MADMGTLYLVATPIGNLADITIRALEILKKVDLILAEDTRHTGILLKHFSIKKPLSSFHEYNEQIKEPEMVQKLKEGVNIALVSDAGTPTLADPGFKLVRTAIKERINVVSIPGANAVLTALTSSGLPTDSFSFLGYVPKKEGKRREFYERIRKLLEDIKTTVIFFESPHRVSQTLAQLRDIFPERNLVLARELTKLNEQVLRGKVDEIYKALSTKSIKGEVTLILR